MPDLQSPIEELNHLVHIDTSEKVEKKEKEEEDVRASLVSSAACQRCCRCTLEQRLTTPTSSFCPPLNPLWSNLQLLFNLNKVFNQHPEMMVSSA